MRGKSMEKEADYRWIDVAPDYRGRLQQFECAEAKEEYFQGAEGRHGRYYLPYELEVQNVIRNFRHCDSASQWAHMAVIPGKNGTERIISFVWFGIVGGTRYDASGYYTIGYIARSLDAKNCKMGYFTLLHALKVLKKDYDLSKERLGRQRPDEIAARIDPENKKSIALFESFDFRDKGPDPNAREYNRFVRVGF